MTEQNYSKRELDHFLEEFTKSHIDLKNTIETNQEENRSNFKGMTDRQDFTNGKIKKIIVAMVAFAAFALGAVGKDAILPILLKSLI